MKLFSSVVYLGNNREVYIQSPADIANKQPVGDCGWWSFKFRECGIKDEDKTTPFKIKKARKSFPTICSWLSSLTGDKISDTNNPRLWADIFQMTEDLGSIPRE